MKLLTTIIGMAALSLPITGRGKVMPGGDWTEPEEPEDDPTGGLKNIPQWPHWKTVDLDDPNHRCFVLDTRDFHMNRMSNQEKHLAKLGELVARNPKLNKNPIFYEHTTEELATLLSRYEQESTRSGLRFSLEGLPLRANASVMKYLHIYRVGAKFIVCNREDFIFHKTDLAAQVRR